MDLTLLFSKTICVQWKELFDASTVEQAVKIPRELVFRKMRGFGPAGYQKLEEAARSLKLDVIPEEHPQRMSFRRQVINAFNKRPWIGRLSVDEKKELVDDVLATLAVNAVSAEELYNQDIDSEDQVQVFPMPWMNQTNH